MQEARFTVSFGALTHDGAHQLVDKIDLDPRADALALIINETDERSGLWEVVAYFETEYECRELALVFKAHESVIAPIVQENWVEKSLQGLQPVLAGRFFLYGSHDANRRRSGGVSLLVNASMAFGTGHHATTTGCLLAIDSILKAKRPAHIFDLGCGTGVLAIATQKVARTKTLATDIDPESVRITKANAAVNAVAPALSVHTAPGLKHQAIKRAAPFDLISANILARPLAQLAQGLSGLLKPDGRLILSGLTLDQKRWIQARYRNTGLILDRTIEIGNWATLVFKRVRPNA
jgi:ribosomal protein L11 methyltransferase